MAAPVPPFLLRPFRVQYLFPHTLIGDVVVMEILLPAERIQQRISALARQVADDYQGRPVTIVGVLTGCLMFLADLVRHLDLSLRIGLIQASSYRGPVTAAG